MTDMDINIGIENDQFFLTAVPKSAAAPEVPAADPAQ